MNSPSSPFGQRLGSILLFSFFPLFSFCVAIESSGTDMTWTGKTNNIWMDGNGAKNWDGGNGIIQSGDNAIFNNTTGNPYSITLSGAVSPTEINVLEGETILSGTGYIKSGTLNISDGGILDLNNTMPNTFTGGANVGSWGELVLTSQTYVENSRITVAKNGLLTVAAAQSKSDASIQGGALILETGSFVEISNPYDIDAGEDSIFYIATGITDFTDNSTLVDVDSKLIDMSNSLNLDSSNNVYVDISRNYAQDVYSDLSATVAGSIDTYRGGNPELDYLLSLDDTDSVGAYLQNAYDFINLSGAASAMYEAHQAVSSVLHQRLIDGHVLPRSYVQPNPCPPNNYYRGQCAPKSIARYTPSSLITATTTTLGTGPVCEVWVAPLYQNTKGFGLYSGSMRYGYKNDMGGIAAGLDRTDGALRYGVMGVGGGGKVESNGDVAATKNDTGFGGVYGYLNERFHGANFFVQGGWMGMQNKISQTNDYGSMSGKMNNGLFSIGGTLSQMFCFDGLHLTTTLGIEYGYYYQDSLTPGVNGDQIDLNYGEGKANIWMMPVGARLSREFSLNQCGVLTPELHAKYIWNFGNTGVGYNAWTDGIQYAAPMFAYMTDRNNYDVGAGLGWFNDHWSLRGDYSFIWSKHRQSNLFSITGAYKF